MGPEPPACYRIAMQAPPPPPPRPRSPGLGPERVLLASGALYLFYFSLQGLLAEWLGISFLTVLLPAGLALVLLPWLLLSRVGLDPLRTLRLGEGPGRGQAAGAIFVGVASFLPAERLGALGVRWWGEPELMAEILEALTPHGPLDWALGVATVVVVGPLGEELLFRGLLQQAARSTMRPLLAAVAIGLLFGGLHFLPAYLLALSFVGIVLGLLFERSANLWSCVLAHASYNALVLVALGTLGPEGTLPGLASEGQAWLAAGVATALVALTLGRMRPERPW